MCLRACHRFVESIARGGGESACEHAEVVDEVHTTPWSPHADATKLMKREGIRSVPAFHFWKKGAKVEVRQRVQCHRVQRVAVRRYRHL